MNLASIAPAPMSAPTVAPAASAPAADPAAILTGAKTIAVVGMSAKTDVPAHFAPMELARRGWNVIPVNPTVSEVAGMKSYASLADVPVPVDVVNVFRNPAAVPGIAAEAAAIGAKALWLQVGVTSAEGRAIAEQAGMSFVEDTCAGATAARLDLRPQA